LGALRPDKFTISEIEHLRDLLADGTDRYRLIAAVRPSVNLPATEPEVSVLNMSSDQPLSDDTVAKALAQADALVAPYRNATDSGTVMLALSAGLPVLAFETGALGTHLTKESLVPVDDWHSLAKKCTNAKQMSVSHEWAQDVQNEARAAWRGVIASAWL
jgi:glycosyltransferase involved in cell wall biosynthesis